MRRAFLLALAVPACTEASDGTAIECRLGDAAVFGRTCTLERRETDRGLEMIVRRPDGGFRRLIGTGASIEAADGAEQPAVTRLADGRLEIEIGGDVYRVPPRVPE